jgi:hypothetical protein
MGHQPGGCPAGHRLFARSGQACRRRSRSERAARRWTTWDWCRVGRLRERPSTRCSSAPAPMRGSRTCGPPPPCWRPHGQGAGPGLAGVAAGQGAGGTGGARPHLHRGGSRVGRFRLFHVRRHERRQVAEPGKRCASTTNRNFKGPSGARGTHPSDVPGHGRGGRRDRRTSPMCARCWRAGHERMDAP